MGELEPPTPALWMLHSI